MNKKKLSTGTSVSLDIVRIFSALLVFFHHCYSEWFSNAFGEKLASLAHLGVVIFFVLSGYLITYTTTTNDRGALQYAKARLSRLYSVLFPAMIVTIVCQLLLYLLDRSVFLETARGHVAVRDLMSLGFVSEIWFFSSQAPLNGPIWSVGYEFWYYVIYGCFFYVPRSWKGYTLLVLTILIAGPSIISMMPIWLLGALAYKLKKLKLSNPVLIVLAVITLIIAIFLDLYMPELPFKLGQSPLHFANQFITDTICGIFIACTIWCLGSLGDFSIETKVINRIRKYGDLTFPLYLLHFPLLKLATVLLKVRGGDIVQFCTFVSVILIACLILGHFIESKRRLWSGFFEVVLNKLSGSGAKPAA